MNYQISTDTAFPVVTLTLDQDEQVQIESGSMIYHDGQIKLEGKMNNNGKKGLGGLMSAIGRSMTSGESFFITTATGTAPQSELVIAPGNPGAIRALPLDSTHQWRLNTGAFLAADATAGYTMVRQKTSNALLGGTGGFFVMESQGSGAMLVSAYGDILEVTLDGSRDYVIDNDHVVAWSQSLDYNIAPASGFVGFKTGEGLVNQFHGQGTVYIQTRNLNALADLVAPFLPEKSGD
ncbi:TIGR00266 family protein [Lacticaseibacillus saniviri]